MDDDVTLELAGTKVDRVLVDLGDGDNKLTLKSGTVSGSFAFTGGSGSDEVSIDESVQIKRSAYVWLGEGDNSLDVAGKIDRSLIVNGRGWQR